jgi:hypothetical protein
MDAQEKQWRLLNGNKPRKVGGTTVVASYHQPETTATTGSSSSSGTTEPINSDEQKKWVRPNLAQLNLKIPNQLASKFDMWCFANHMSKAEAFAKAVELLLASGTTATTSPSGTTATTLLIDDLKTEDNIIISLYCELTGNKWKTDDLMMLRELRSENIPTDKIEAGIVLSVFRCRTRVGSLRYCRGAILEADESGMAEARLYVQRAKVKIAQKEQLKRGGKG